MWRISGLLTILHKLHNKISFQGATTINLLDPPENCAADSYKWGHLAMTYTSIAILVILGDDLSQLDRKGIIEGKFEVFLCFLKIFI